MHPHRGVYWYGRFHFDGWAGMRVKHLQLRRRIDPMSHTGPSVASVTPSVKSHRKHHPVLHHQVHHPHHHVAVMLLWTEHNGECKRDNSSQQREARASADADRRQSVRVLVRRRHPTTTGDASATHSTLAAFINACAKSLPQDVATTSVDRHSAARTSADSDSNDAHRKSSLKHSGQGVVRHTDANKHIHMPMTVTFNHATTCMNSLQMHNPQITLCFRLSPLALISLNHPCSQSLIAIHSWPRHRGGCALRMCSTIRAAPATRRQTWTASVWWTTFHPWAAPCPAPRCNPASTPPIPTTGHCSA